MCLVSVTEPHAFKLHPGRSVGQHQPFRGQAGACCVVSPLLPAIRQHGRQGSAAIVGPCSAGPSFSSHRPWF